MESFDIELPTLTIDDLSNYPKLNCLDYSDKITIENKKILEKAKIDLANKIGVISGLDGIIRGFDSSDNEEFVYDSYASRELLYLSYEYDQYISSVDGTLYYSYLKDKYVKKSEITLDDEIKQLELEVNTLKEKLVYIHNQMIENLSAEMRYFKLDKKELHPLWLKVINALKTTYVL